MLLVIGVRQKNFPPASMRSLKSTNSIIACFLKPKRSRSPARTLVRLVTHSPSKRTSPRARPSSTYVWRAAESFPEWRGLGCMKDGIFLESSTTLTPRGNREFGPLRHPLSFLPQGQRTTSLKPYEGSANETAGVAVHREAHDHRPVLSNHCLAGHRRRLHPTRHRRQARRELTRPVSH